MCILCSPFTIYILKVVNEINKKKKKICFSFLVYFYTSLNYCYVVCTHDEHYVWFFCVCHLSFFLLVKAAHIRNTLNQMMWCDVHSEWWKCKQTKNEWTVNRFSAYSSLNFKRFSFLVSSHRFLLYVLLRKSLII